MNTQTLALVVARGGSKGIPRKNLRTVGGRPLIAHTLLAARRSRLLDRIILSTDDGEIADVARSYGIDVPFMRPAELARDTSHVMETTLHALDWLDRHEGCRPGRMMLLQPTSPFRTEEDIDAAVGLALERDARAVVSVCEARRHPCLAKRIEPGGTMCPFFDTGLQTSRRTDLPPAYDLNGAIYLVKRDVLLAERSWCPPGTQAFVMPAERSMDVDSAWDLALADLVMTARESPVGTPRGHARAPAETGIYADRRRGSGMPVLVGAEAAAGG